MMGHLPAWSVAFLCRKLARLFDLLIDVLWTTINSDTQNKRSGFFLKFTLVSWEGRLQSLLTTRSGWLHPTSESGEGFESSSESARIEALSWVPALCSKRGQLRLGSSGVVLSSFEHLQGPGLHNTSRLPVSVLLSSWWFFFFLLTMFNCNIPCCNLVSLISHPVTCAPLRRVWHTHSLGSWRLPQTVLETVCSCPCFGEPSLSCRASQFSRNSILPSVVPWTLFLAFCWTSSKVGWMGVNKFL